MYAVVMRLGRDPYMYVPAAAGYVFSHVLIFVFR